MVIMLYIYINTILFIYIIMICSNNNVMLERNCEDYLHVMKSLEQIKTLSVFPHGMIDISRVYII